MKMQSQLILLTVGAVAPLSALVVAVAFWSIGQQRDMTADTMRDTSFILALALERELSGTVSTLEGLGLSRTLPNQDYEGFRHKASGLTGRRKLWSAIAVADPDGSR